MGENLYKDCKGHWRETRGEKLVWCNPASFSFKKDEMQWLLPLLKDIEEGFYVPEPGGNYTDLGIMSRRIKAGAYFELIMSIRGEVVWRLGQLYTERDRKLDRFLLEGKYCDEKDDFKQAHVARISAEEVERRINRALNYISGTKRTITTYEDFVNHPRVKKFPAIEPKVGRRKGASPPEPAPQW